MYAIAIVVGASLGVVVAFVVHRLSLLRIRSRRVVIHTRGGSSVGGLLVGTYPGHVALRSASLIGPDSDTPLAGDVVIERAAIDFIQVT